MLYDKWWKNTGDTCVRKDGKKKESKASALGVDSIGGVFVVLIFGLIFAICVSICEFCHSARKRKNSLEDGSGRMVVAKRRNVYVEMIDEFCFALKCLGPRQRPAMKRDCSKCFRQTQMRHEMAMPTTILTTALLEDNNKRYLRLRRGSSMEHQTGYCCNNSSSSSNTYCHSYSLSVSPSPSHNHHLRHVESFRVSQHFLLPVVFLSFLFVFGRCQTSVC